MVNAYNMSKFTHAIGTRKQSIYPHCIRNELVAVLTTLVLDIELIERR